jgi:hypothetical protein
LRLLAGVELIGGGDEAPLHERDRGGEEELRVGGGEQAHVGEHDLLGARDACGEDGLDELGVLEGADRIAGVVGAVGVVVVGDGLGVAAHEQEVEEEVVVAELGVGL